MAKRLLIGLGLCAALAIGCTESDQSMNGLSDEVARLEAQNAALETQLDQVSAEVEAKDEELDQALAQVEVGAQELEEARRLTELARAASCSLRDEELDRLTQCEHLLFGVTKYPSVEAKAPGILFIPTHGYRTIEQRITVEVMAVEGSTVTVDGAVAHELMGYAGGFMRYTGEADLDVGSNAIDVSVASPEGQVVELPMVVYHDPQLEQRFGFVVSTPIEGYGPSWQVGIDYVNVELGSEFGNSYDNPTVDVEVLPVSVGALALVRDGATGFGIYGEELLVLTGPEIRDLFYGFHGHPERLDGDPHTWVFSILLDDGEVVQFEPIPIGS